VCVFARLWCRKTHLLHRPASIFLYLLSHQLNHLAFIFSAGITVADYRRKGRKDHKREFGISPVKTQRRKGKNDSARFGF
jgi:hypothetical protein